MAKKYIKSYSNYVLKTKHQQTNDGTIYERDITTIGGRDQFARGQVPIYRTGNFVITTNNDISSYRKVSENDWHRNDEGEVWTLNTLKHFEKDEKSSYDKKIVIKKDYFDLRDFAYYGSCSELIRVSINDILKNYPGELFVPYETLYSGSTGIQYTEEAAKEAWGNNYKPIRSGIKGYYTSFETKKTREVKYSCEDGDKIGTLNSVSLIDELTPDEKEQLELGIPYTREFKYITDAYGNVIEEKNLALIDNPFLINIHNKFVPDGENPLKYFAEGGIDNYVGYLKSNGEWNFDEEYALSIESILFDGIGESEKSTKIFSIDGNSNCPPGSVCNNEISIDILSHENIEKSTGCTLDCIDPGKYIGKMKICFKKIDYSFKTTPGLSQDDDGDICNKEFTGCLEFGGKGGEGLYNNECTKVDSFRTDEPDYCLEIYIFMGNNNEIKYLVDEDKDENFVSRIRPKKEIIEDYFNNLDLFEKVLLNRESDPLYTASFELINDDDYGMYTYTRQFTFPTTYGGYNLGSSNQLFTEYINSLSEVGEYYDSLFTDNLWRSMTHESIKNFDWTYTRHYTPGEEEPFVEAGTKIQKIIRVYGREFDEVKSYIDAIDDLNTITYNNVNNIPDYFFTDKLEEQGWDVKLIHPLELSEFVNGHDNVPIDMHTLFPNKYDEEGNKICTEDAEKLNYFYDAPIDTYDRNKITIQRVFNQKDVSVVPYSCSNITTIKEIKKNKCSEQYDTSSKLEFNIDDELNPCVESGFTVGVGPIEGEDVRKGYHNGNGDIIKIYCDENKYSSADVNNEFLKRLILNSPEIWRHKGTIEGIEMLLSLFGLKSKNRIYTDEKYFINQKDLNDGETSETLDINVSSIHGCGPNLSFDVDLSVEKSNCLSLTKEGKKYYKNYSDNLYNLYDYDIKEYTLFTTREEDEWVESKNMYKLDWVNSTKLMPYINENTTYEAYKGLPVILKQCSDDSEGNKGKRYIYPYFNSYETYDGNPYYQMDGGWLQKKPFMFDVKNNIVLEDYESENRKNKSLFTETVKNIKCVNTLQDLLSNPSLVNGSGDICQVTDLSGRFAIIDGYVYPLLNELTDSEGSGNTFFYAHIQNNSLSVGNVLFTDYVIISNPYFDSQKQRIDLTDDYYTDREIKIYILGDSEKGYDVDVYSKDSSISTFTVFENGKYMDGDNYTNYFRINNVDYYNELSVLGWQQLKKDEYEYYRMNTLSDYREGNNPHTGHMNYDNGHKYLTYLQKVFKYVDENDFIDYRQYDDADIAYIDEMSKFGFKNLIDEDECELDYDKYLREDNKCHFFGALDSIVDNNCNDARKGLSCFRKRELSDSSRYNVVNGECKSKKIFDECLQKYVDDSYRLTDIFRKNIIIDDGPIPRIESLKYGQIYDKIGEYGEYDYEKIDNVTNQIVNTKRMEIEFFIKNKHEYSKEWLEEVKYIDSVILPYLTQMIPSTVIWRVKYTTRDKESWCSNCKEKCDCENITIEKA